MVQEMFQSQKENTAEGGGNGTVHDWKQSPIQLGHFLETVPAESIGHNQEPQPSINTDCSPCYCLADGRGACLQD